MACALTLLPAAAAKAPDWKQAKVEVVVGGLDMPVDIDVAPDGSIWFIELEGNVRRHDVGANRTTTVHSVDVVTGGERGLVGFALGRDFAANGTYFLYYTQATDDPAGGINRLVRVQDGKETLLTTVPGAKEHNGGRIVATADGTLFVGTGENQLRDPAQDPKSLLGKILHLTTDGKAVAGNLDGLVYSKGHRNVYGLALDEATGRLWSTENSGWRRDEVNAIQAGGNYGYPECEGHGLNGVDTPCPTTKGYIFPLRTFYEDNAVAPTGAAFWQGEFYWASLNEGSIHHLWNDTAGWQDEQVLVLGPPILDLDVGPDGALYLSTTDDIRRITLDGSGGQNVDATTSTAPRTSGATEGPTEGSTSRSAPAPWLGLAILAVVAIASGRRRSR